MMDPAPSPAPTAPAPVPQPEPTWENRLPGWQQWINSFCENWIFAFIVAMTIRHFCLEAFRIPTASMEPMLYGDPAFSKADHVVVDKFFFRFTGPSRWDVTVFQFPLPEVEPRKGEQTDARIAIAANGDRLDQVLVRPLMYRNFVKRAVILPGDVYYIAGGNIYLKQADGSFQVSRKPQSVQDELWQEVYRFGVQPEYQPWLGEGGSSASDAEGALKMTLVDGGGISLFQQQFRNLYLKPGRFQIAPIVDIKNPNARPYELVDLSMTSPNFTYRASNRKGTAWDMFSWWVKRMNSSDLDHLDRGHTEAGTLLNETMTEWVGDVRFRTRIAELTGTVALDLTQGNQHAFRLQLSPTGWAVQIDGKQIAVGQDSPLMTDLEFGLLDDQVFFTLGGKEMARQDVTANDPGLHRLGARWSGTGSLTFSRLTMDRDVHYTLGNNGSFLRPESVRYRTLESKVEQGLRNPYVDQFDLDSDARDLRLLTGIRSQMLGKPVNQLTEEELYGAIGNSPASALTAPPGAYLMMGDNSPQSWDSRCWGYVASENLRGRVLAVVLPFSRWRVVR